MTSSNNSRVVQIFEYLLAVKRLNEHIIRNVNEYEKVWWQSDIPNMEGCFLNGNGANEEAWLEVHKQKIEPTPTLPRALHTWIEKWENPDEDPRPLTKKLIGFKKEVKDEEEQVSLFTIEEEQKEIYELFTDDDERVETYKNWMKNTWKPWANDTSPKLKIQRIYDELFALHQRLQREGDDLEVNWGHGLLSWNINDQKIQRHVLVTRLELQFNAKKGVFYLLPTSKGIQLETDMLTNIEIPNAARLHEMETQLEELEYTPWDEEGISSLYKEVVHTISPNGSYHQTENPLDALPKFPVIQHQPAIFLRSNNGRIWDKELTTAIQKIKEGYPVPQTVTVLTTNEKQQQKEETNAEWSSVGEDLLFPLPANKEQKLIAQKLASSEGVVVQGPPGTGKSHTIANLISHLLAHGKRVLITSEKERALQVLRDKIPDEIRALCVSVLGGDSRSVKEIEESVKVIAENLDSKQPEVLYQNIQRLQVELDKTRRNIARYNTLINQSAESENESMTIGGTTFTPLEAAKWKMENQQYKFIPDSIAPTVNYPLTAEETTEFFRLLGVIDRHDKLALDKHRPSSHNLANTNTFEKNVIQIKSIETKVKDTEKYIEGWKISTDLSFDLEEQLSFSRKALENIQQIKSQEWLNLVFEDVIQLEDKLIYWKEFQEEVKLRINTVEQLTSELIEDDIQIPSDQNVTILLEDLNQIKQRFKENKGIGWAFKKLIGRKYSYLFEKVSVNGLPIRNQSDVEKVIKFVEKNEILRKLVLKWNRMLEDINGPELNSEQRRLSATIREYLESLQQVLDWKSEVIQPMSTLVKDLGVPELLKWSETETYEIILDGLSALLNKQEWEEANTFFQEIFDYLHKQNSNTNLHPLNEDLYKACKEKDIDLWRSSYNEILRLEGLEEDYNKFVSLKEKLDSVAPRWVELLLENDGESIQLQPPDDIDLAWKWSQVDHWLKDIHSRPKLEDLELEQERERKKESKLIQEIVAESTWKSQLERTSREQKRSLFAWLKAIQRIGKGTGKYAGVYRKEASKEMKTARGAIPVWIMPINRVIENIELTNELFDVVIVDESSQSTLFSLSALLRGKKAVIVGDDNQISPDSVGTDISEVHELIERHLYNIPNKLQFEMKTSLYDTASRVYDSKIILKEHFRCVPEIIQFSNDFMYNGLIDPLRLPSGNEVLEPPVKAIRVMDGYRREDTKKAINEPEAEAIVNYIATCCQDPRYREKSMGVISLQGHDQAKLIENMLREKIGEEEMIDRGIICGDSYSFQGDERDVIFLSMVAASNVRFAAMTKRDAQQRFNVAASRARDQMLLFHSVDLSELNPLCVRYKLLQYCQEPHRVQLAIEEVKNEFDSKFEEDVFRIITAKGYKVIPQVKVGTVGKKIDLVIEGMRNRLAVECDGDAWHGLDKWEEDMERQRVLERVGWTFWRIRGSQFYLDREKAMSSLWEKLEEMGIEPVSRISLKSN
ncbi:AAA domain-containing protein [Bacillus carboniphilus]|uniref:AAA domain-containing protein n=1 Tax=Bacillus carboniphilus TaxID=86663 RepID=A0ABP3G682_9BACI